MQPLKDSLVAAKIEIYGESDRELQLAERHRFHLMDAGVSVAKEPDAYRVTFIARAQRTDFPHVEPARIFAALKTHFASTARDRGYRVVEERVRDVTDPMDDRHVLDVWYETTFTVTVPDIDAAVDEARWALSVEKYVRPE